MTALALILAAAASAAEAPLPSPVVVVTTAPVGAAPVGAASVAMLKDAFIEATDEETKTRALERLSAATPSSSKDVAALFDLFSRFNQMPVRRAVMASVSRLTPGRPDLEGQFVAYLKQPETEAQLFGINGAFRLRAEAALPLVRKIAERKFSVPNAEDGAVSSERNAWWTQYEALSALAQWDGEKALPLVRRKAEEAPTVGRLLGAYYWKQTLPSLKAWSESADAKTRERAVRAAAAPIAPADARATRAEMMAILKDKKADVELRHQLALKIGASSKEEEVDELLAAHDAEPDASERLFWASAAALTGSKKVVPLLVRYAARSEDETMSQAARGQLTDMVGAAEAEKLIQAEKTPKK